jgi:hypothetical protein
MDRFLHGIANLAAARMKPRKYSLEGHENVFQTDVHPCIYNSSEFLRAMTKHGQLSTLIPIGRSSFIPIFRPREWSHSAKQHLPIPPFFAGNTSIHLGIISSIDNPSKDIVQGLPELIQSRNVSTGLEFVQPVLNRDGVNSFSSDLISAIESTGQRNVATRTRIIEFNSEQKLATDFNILTTEELIELDRNLDISASYLSKRRYDIRRALRSGNSVTVEKISSDLNSDNRYNSIMAIHQESWTRTGLGFHSLKYWTDTSRAIRTRGEEFITAVRDSNGTICSVVVVHILGQSAFYQMNSTSISGLKTSASSLCLHAAILAAAAHGCCYFELGRTSIADSGKQKTVFEFKSEFGGSDFPVANLSLAPKIPHKWL